MISIFTTLLGFAYTLPMKIEKWFSILHAVGWMKHALHGPKYLLKLNIHHHIFIKY